MNWNVPMVVGKNHVYRKEEKERDKGK